MGRKVIQLAPAVYYDQNVGGDYVLTALCDDGTIWQKVNADAWDLIPDVPQSAIKESISGRPGEMITPLSARERLAVYILMAMFSLVVRPKYDHQLKEFLQTIQSAMGGKK